MFLTNAVWLFSFISHSASTTIKKISWVRTKKPFSHRTFPVYLLTWSSGTRLARTETICVSKFWVSDENWFSIALHVLTKKPTFAKNRVQVLSDAPDYSTRFETMMIFSLHTNTVWIASPSHRSLQEFATSQLCFKANKTKFQQNTWNNMCCKNGGAFPHSEPAFYCQNSASASTVETSRRQSVFAPIHLHFHRADKLKM